LILGPDTGVQRQPDVSHKPVVRLPLVFTTAQVPAHGEGSAWSCHGSSCPRGHDMHASLAGQAGALTRPWLAMTCPSVLRHSVFGKLRKGVLLQLGQRERLRTAEAWVFVRGGPQASCQGAGIKMDSTKSGA
jgi:hypothetical protein